MVKDYRKNSVVVRNDLVTAVYKMSLPEKRLVLMAISQIKQGEKPTDETLYTVRLKDYQELIGLEAVTVWQEMTDAVSQLKTKWIKVLNGNVRTEFAILQRIDYIPDKSVISIRFSKDILPYISELREQFTQYKLIDAVGFRSVYTIRFYELFIQWRNVGSYTLELTHLKEMFLLEDKYKLNADITRKIVKPALQEINDSGLLLVSMQYVKTGRAITAYHFKITIPKNPPIEQTAESSVVTKRKPKVPTKKFLEKFAPPGFSYEESAGLKEVKDRWEICKDWLAYL